MRSKNEGHVEQGLIPHDAVYWVPAMDGDEYWTEDPENDVGLIYMDRAGLEVRIFHIDSRDSNATDPTPYTA